MPLYSAKIKFTVTLELPIQADSAEAATNYLKTTDEWKKDSTFDYIDTEKLSFEICEAKKLTRPEDSIWEGDILPWGPNVTDDNIAVVFYEDELKKLEPRSDDEEDRDDEWDAYFEKENEMVKVFDAKRKCG